MDATAKAALLALLRGKVQERLAQPLHALFDELDSRLFDLAERSRVAAQQHLYFDALRHLRLARVDVETDFLQPAEGFVTQIFVHATLDDAEQGVVVFLLVVFFPRALRPAHREAH